jgi:hypothetical protein
VASGDFLAPSLWGFKKEVEAPDSILVSLIILLTLLSDTPVAFATSTPVFFTVIVGPASFIYLHTLLTISLDYECNTFPLNLLRVGGILKETEKMYKYK